MKSLERVIRLSILDSHTYRTIEYYLYNYHELKKEVEEKRKSIMLGGSSEIKDWSDNISLSDPTANKVIQLFKNDITITESWLSVIDKTYEYFEGTHKEKLIELRYFKGMDEQPICRVLYISRATYYNWRNEIIFYTALLAQKYDLIDIEKCAEGS